MLPRSLRNLRVHMVGIAGSGMCGLAAFLLREGAEVSGTDMRAGIELTRLSRAGATVSTTQCAKSVPDHTELLVKSAAIPDDHPEMLAARRRGIAVVKYAEMLGALMSRRASIAISGTHGKSTTAAWLTYVLKQAELDPSFVIGAEVEQLGGGSGVGAGPHFVAEACEYDRSFLNLHPQRLAILNIEEDHLDCYADLSAITEAFTQFAAQVPAGGLLLMNADDECCQKIAGHAQIRTETFGQADRGDWRMGEPALENGCYEFTVIRLNQPLGRVRLGLPGRHNIANALAVIALAHDCGVPWEIIVAALAEFRGVRRRLELRGEIGGVRIVDDYAHHPTEIKATLQAARERFTPRQLWCIFQPHQHSRTRFLMAHFAESFNLAGRVIVPDIYFVRDSQPDREAVCAVDLVNEIHKRGDQAEYIASFEAIVERVAGAVKPGDVVLTMGAGDIWEVADELLRRLEGHLPG